MPVISTTEIPIPKILVTGANGYIGTWIIRTLLERGYQVRGTVRSKEKAEELKGAFKDFAQEGQVEVVIVEDITEASAYTDAVKDVNAVIHTASPVTSNPSTANELVIPAVKGTTNILQSALDHGGLALKRIVILSSAITIYESGKDKTFNEEDWAEEGVTWLNEYGGETSYKSGGYPYAASKVLAEKAAWDFYRTHKSTTSWDLTVLNPSYVYGPPIQPLGPTPDSLNASMRYWWRMISPFVPSASSAAQPASEELLRTLGNCWVDVRDLAEAHVRALEKEEAGGERVIVVAGPYIWREWVDIVRKVVDPADQVERLDMGDIKYSERYNTEKERRILGIPFRSKEDTARDTLDDFKKRGWC